MAIESTMADRSSVGQSSGSAVSRTVLPAAAKARKISRAFAWLKRIGPRWEPYDSVRLPVAILVIAAAGFKSYELLAGAESVGLAVASDWSGWLQISAIPIETTVGVLLILNQWPRVVWGVTVILFAIFSVVSVTGVAAAKETCGCFGAHSPSPANSLILNVFLLLALALVNPFRTNSRLWWLRPGYRLLFVGAIGAGLLVWQGVRYRVSYPLEVDAQYLDIGEQWEQENFKWVVAIRNTRDEPIKVTQINSSCICTSIKPESFTVPPRGTMPVTLTINLTDRKHGAVAEGIRRMSILFAPDVPSEQAISPKWHLTGTTRRLVDGLPAAIEFEKGAVKLGHPPPTKRLYFRSKLPLSQVIATFDPPICLANITRNHDTSPDFQIEITPITDGTTGLRTSKLVLNAYVNDQRMQLSIPASIWTTSDVDTVPGTIEAGAIPMGSTYRETVEIVSHSGTAFKVGGLRVAGVSAKVREVIAGQRYQCTITADAQGSQLGKLRLHIQPANGSAFELVKVIRYFGIGQPQTSHADQAFQSLRTSNAQ